MEFKNFTESLETSFKATQGGEAALLKFEEEIKVGLLCHTRAMRSTTKSPRGSARMQAPRQKPRRAATFEFWMTRMVAEDEGSPDGYLPSDPLH